MYFNKNNCSTGDDFIKRNVHTTSGTCDQFLLNTVDGISQFYLTLKAWHGERAHEVMGYSNLYNGG